MIIYNLNQFDQRYEIVQFNFIELYSLFDFHSSCCNFNDMSTKTTVNFSQG